MKHVYCISNSDITAYRWQANAVLDATRFPADASGLEHIEQWIQQNAAQHHKHDTLILCDLIEEEFIQDTIPHVNRRDSRSIQQRKLNKLFRETDYRQSKNHGRSPVDKQLDQVSFSALTNSTLLDGLIEILERYRVPITSILSAASMASLILKKLNVRTQHNLLISQQDSAHMRQSYCTFNDNRTSRLSHVVTSQDDEYLSLILAEAMKNKRYLNRVQLVPHGETLDIYVLGSAQLKQYAEQNMNQSDAGRFNFIDINSLASAFKCENQVKFQDARLLYVHIACKSVRYNNYANIRTKRWYLHKLLNRGLIGATIIGSILALSSVVFNVISSHHYDQQYSILKQQGRALSAQLAHHRSRIPKSDVTAAEMRALVKAGLELKSRKNKPLVMLSKIGHSLASFPMLKLDQIEWTTSAKLPRALKLAAAKQAPIVTPPGTWFRIVTLKGHLHNFTGDFNYAQKQVRNYFQHLSNSGQYLRVIMTSMPVDTSSGRSITGNTGSNQTQKASFEFILIKPLKRDTSKLKRNEVARHD